MLTKRTLWIGTLVAVFAIVVIGIGRQAGENVAKEDIELLSLVWPYVMDMQQNERALGAGGSRRWGGDGTGTDRGSGSGGVRTGGRDAGARLPKEVPGEEAA